MQATRQFAIALLVAVACDARAEDCPWMKSDAVGKLLGSTDFELTQGEFETCTAKSPLGELWLTTAEADVAPDLAPTMHGGCKKETLPALGEWAAVAYDCMDVLESPLAAVHAIVGDKLVEYIFQPGRHPTPAERALLIQVATDSQAAAKAGAGQQAK